MEAVGAVASFIAIGDAVGKLPKIVSFFRSLPEIQNEAASLANELETLRATHIHIQNVAKSLTSASDGFDDDILKSIDTSVLERAVNELSTVLQTLNDFHNACHASKGGSGPKDVQKKVKKVRFLWEKHKLQDIRQRVLNVRSDLQLALSALMMHFHRSQNRILLDLQQISVTSNSKINSEINDLRTLLENQVIRTKDDNEKDREPDAADELPKCPTTTSDKSQGLYPSDICKVSTANQYNIMDHGDDEQFIQLQATMLGVCPPRCPCRCHLSSTSRGPEPAFNWLKPVLGSLLINYNAIPIWSRKTCTEASCLRSGSSVRVNYTFPSWLCARTLSIQASLSSLANFGATLHFTIGRVFPINSSFYELSLSSLSLFQRSREIYNPRDVMFNGDSFLYLVIIYENYELLAFLVALWKPILRHTGVERRSFTLATNTLYNIQHGRTQCHDQKAITSLQQLTGYGKDHEGLDSPLPFQLVLNEDKTPLIKALQQNPWSVNGLDIHGESPLNYAVLTNDEVALQILIQKGADINALDVFGETPLMVAAYHGSFGCARLLVDAGSKLRASANYGGDTPLHRAVRSPSPQSIDTMDLLLERDQGLVRLQNGYGQTALHALAHGADKQESPTLARKIRLLLDHGSDIDGRDLYGNTALEIGFWNNQVGFCEMLVEAGALLQTRKSYSLFKTNTLHDAAWCCKAEMLNWLRGRNLLGLDVNAVDIEGDTPWDVFIYTLEVAQIDFALMRRLRKPTDEDVVAFVRLYLHVRSLNIKRDMETLGAVAAALRGKQLSTACELLHSLKQRTKESESSTDAGVDTYRVMIIQVKEQMCDAAMEAVEEIIDILQEKMTSSPWKQKSRYDGAQKVRWSKWYDANPDKLWEGLDDCTWESSD